VSRRILVVEDEPDIATIFRMLFGSAGHAVAHAAELAAARDLLERGPAPDLVILDVLLPDGDGVDLCREIKTRVPPAPVVVITADASASERAAAAGADLVLVKPFDPDDLEAQVERLLEATPVRAA
jgi:DNA-binding response OmpR family regulator